MKVLESLVNKHLSNCLSANNLISPFQSGFRCGDSAPLQLFRLTTELFAALDSRVVAATVFYDFKKAFDSVWHRALIGKLFSPGVSGSALEWLSDFITDCTQHVQVGDSLSDPGSPTAGVPQGSPLSPTLFILFINSATSSTSCPTNCFADDTCTNTPGLPFITAQQKIQSDVTAPATWAGDHKLIIHPEKTVCMLFHHPSHHPPELHIRVNNHATTQSPWCYTFFHPFLVTPCRSSYLSLFCNAWSSSSSPLLLPLFISLSTKSLSLLHTPTSGVRLLIFWRFVCSLCSPAWSRLSNRRHCPFVVLILLASLNSVFERRSSILPRLFFLFLMTMPPGWPPVRLLSVAIFHTATTRTLRNSSAIRLPCPRTSLFLSSPLYLAASAYNSSCTSIWAELLIIFTPSFYNTNLF